VEENRGKFSLLNDNNPINEYFNIEDYRFVFVFFCDVEYNEKTRFNNDKGTPMSRENSHDEKHFN